jgi:hypothetical protein
VQRRPGAGFLIVAFGVEIDELDRDDTGAVEQRSARYPAGVADRDERFGQ